MNHRFMTIGHSPQVLRPLHLRLLLCVWRREESKDGAIKTHRSVSRKIFVSERTSYKLQNSVLRIERTLELRLMPALGA